MVGDFRKSWKSKLALHTHKVPLSLQNHSPKPRLFQNTCTHIDRQEANQRHDWETPLVEGLMQRCQIISCLINQWEKVNDITIIASFHSRSVCNSIMDWWTGCAKGYKRICWQVGRTSRTEGYDWMNTPSTDDVRIHIYIFRPLNLVIAISMWRDF